MMLLGRHGEAPPKPEGGSFDRLTDRAIPVLYDRGVELVDGRTFGLDRTFLVHTDADRTIVSGEGVIAGSVGYKRPENLEQLRSYRIREQLQSEAKDDGLCIRRPYCVNMKIFKAQGAGPCIDYWLAHPEAEKHDGERIVPYTQLRNEVRGSVKSAVGKLVDGNTDLGVLVSHSGMIEQVLFVLVNSGIEKPIERVADIGGILEMAEFARLAIDYVGGVYKAEIRLKGQKYEVDLNNL